MNIVTPSALLGFVLAIAWAGYKFVYKREKPSADHVLHLVVVALLGPVLFYGVEMGSYGLTGSFLLNTTSLETIREPMSFGGLGLIFIAVYFVLYELGFIGKNSDKT